MAKVIEKCDNYEIITHHTSFFENFFDLKTDYSFIKQQLKNKYGFLDKAIDFGYGIRILNQNPTEMVISFIISANNNIPRIKKSIKGICEKFGENKGEYFSFPTLEELSDATEEDFKNLGLGYRAGQMVKAINQLNNFNLKSIKNLSTNNAIDELLKISGVGPKVADCIMLFGLHDMNVFPVDTWIEKVYNTYFTTTKQDNRRIIRENLTKEFGSLSGYAQQYLFYFQRSGQ